MTNDERLQERRDSERRTIAPLILARLLGSRSACEEIKDRAAELRGTGPAVSFAASAARHAIAFADALIDELDKRENR